ncbi:MAG: hypothetical protein IKN74_03060 [Clostridia bacterium]|nr:hypothetical protein [Clostridia bacterium]
MNSNDLEKSLKEKYNCKLITEIKDNGKTYAKAIEVQGKTFRYRYFNIENDSVSEVLDAEEYKHLREEYEIDSQINY